jgi:hypothetical protein
MPVFRCTRSILAIGALTLVACATARVTVRDEPIRENDPLSIDVTRSDAALLLGGATVALVARSTLEHFWNLASLQARDPAIGARLLDTEPRNPAKTLEPLGIDSHGYERQLAKAGVRPLILFLPHDADPIEEARRHGLPIAEWPRSSPPALLFGPTVNTLILFEPLTSAGAEPGRTGPVVRARIASLAVLASLSLAALSTLDDPLDRQSYQVLPRAWQQAVTFEHMRCRYAGAELREGTVLITTLTYQGGVTKALRTPLSKQDWKPCPLKRGVPGVVVKQPSLGKAGRPAIIAGSYFEDPAPSPLIADWIEVK